jgi:hypothetical protein
MKRAAQRRIEKGQRSSDSRQQRHKPKRDWYDKAVLRVYLATLLTTAAATGFMGYQSYLMRNTLISSQRAWIAPHGVRIDPLPWDNGLARPVVLYRNVGREPAINVRQKIEVFGHPNAKLQWPPNNMSVECSRAKEGRGSITTAYPSDAINYEAGIDVFRKGAGKETFREMFSKVNIVFVYGCFVYESFGVERHSQFCFYLRPVADKPETEWQWRFCSKGNEAN